MGVYLNPGNEQFRMAVNSDIYVDKTMLISKVSALLNTENRFLAISRPRRFGKSMAANMLAAYYGKECDSSGLFASLKISQDLSFCEHLNKYNVIKINMQEFLNDNENVDDMILDLEHEIISELKYEYKDVIIESEIRLSRVLDRLYAKIKEKFIFIIDEWDCLLRERKSDVTAQKKYLDFLRGLLKDKAYVVLAYITGILPVKKYGTHSALNMFDEYSMTSAKEFAEFTGFTDSEVESLCQKYDMDFEMVKSWYDGYYLEKAGHIYNPRAVVRAVLDRNFDNYWTRTETYEALKIYIDMNLDGLKDAIVRMMSDEKVVINTNKFSNDMTTINTKDDVLTLLIHLGYVAYDSRTSEVYIPNYEIKQEFENAIEGEKWSDVVKAIRNSQRLLENTWKLDEEAVSKNIDEVHSEFTSILSYNDENSLTCVLSMAYYKAIDYYTRVYELPTGKGFADLVFIPKKNVDKPALVIELKYDKSVVSALDQIKEKKYMQGIGEYQENTLLIGINYDKKTKKHECVIEKW